MKKICRNKRYMNYGYLSPHALCAQPPVCCEHEAHEVVRLQTGKYIQQYYCTFTPPAYTAPVVSVEAMERQGCKPGGT